jgi:hypothetical protein
MNSATTFEPPTLRFPPSIRLTATTQAAFNRLGDNWRPLFAIAHVAGGDWPDRVLAAFNHLAIGAHDSGRASSARVPDSNLALTQPPVNSVNSINPINASLRPGHQPSTTNQLLLSDLRSIFTSAGRDRLFSKQLVAALNSLPDRPWSHANNGHPVTEAWLGHTLRQLGIHSRNLQVQNQRCKGYLLADFSSVFSNLAPNSESSPSSFST